MKVMVVKNKVGSILVVVLLLMTCFLGIAALVVDVGVAYADKSHIAKALDSAAIAGAMELKLPDGRNKAIAKAIEYAAKNDVEIDVSNITISDSDSRITISKDIQSNQFFGRVLGLTPFQVDGKSEAVIGPLGGYSGIRPFAIDSLDYTHGQQFSIKKASIEGYSGNFGYADLDGHVGGGTPDLREWIKNGYPEMLYVGQYIYTETGNKTPAVNTVKAMLNTDETYLDYYDESDRVWVVPYVESMEVDGAKQVMILGFAEIFVESVTGNGANSRITARFLRPIDIIADGPVNTDPDAPDTGVNAVNLVKPTV